MRRPAAGALVAAALVAAALAAAVSTLGCGDAPERPRPLLGLTGECPGTVTLTYSGGTASTPAAMLFSATEGRDRLTEGPCSGTPTSLARPDHLAVLTLDETGSFTIDRWAPDDSCGYFLQVIDTVTCRLSNLVVFPPETEAP